MKILIVILLAVICTGCATKTKILPERVAHTVGENYTVDELIQRSERNRIETERMSEERKRQQEINEIKMRLWEIERNTRK